MGIKIDWILPRLDYKDTFEYQDKSRSNCWSSSHADDHTDYPTLKSDTPPFGTFQHWTGFTVSSWQKTLDRGIFKLPSHSKHVDVVEAHIWSHDLLEYPRKPPGVSREALEKARNISVLAPITAKPMVESIQWQASTKCAGTTMINRFFEAFKESCGQIQYQPSPLSSCRAVWKQFDLHPWPPVRTSSINYCSREEASPRQRLPLLMSDRRFLPSIQILHTAASLSLLVWSVIEITSLDSVKRQWNGCRQQWLGWSSLIL